MYNTVFFVTLLYNTVQHSTVLLNFQTWLHCTQVYQSPKLPKCIICPCVMQLHRMLPLQCTVTLQFVPPLKWTELLSCEVQPGRIRKCDPDKTLEVPVRLYCDSGTQCDSLYPGVRSTLWIRGTIWLITLWHQEDIRTQGHNLTQYARESGVYDEGGVICDSVYSGVRSTWFIRGTIWLIMFRSQEYIMNEGYNLNHYTQESGVHYESGLQFDSLSSGVRSAFLIRVTISTFRNKSTNASWLQCNSTQNKE